MITRAKQRKMSGLLGKRKSAGGKVEPFFYPANKSLQGAKIWPIENSIVRRNENRKAKQRFVSTSQSNEVSLIKSEHSPVPKIKITSKPNSMKYQDFRRELNPKSKAKSQNSLPQISDLILLGKLGEGSFGEVILTQLKTSKELYALKIQKKARLVGQCAVHLAIREKNILKSLSHPFITSFKFHFKDNSNIYLGLEYVPGGNLYTFLQNQTNGKISVDHARFYCAQLVLALQYLHERKIVFRDLKLENILLDAKGYLKLTDFGYATELQGSIRERIGTPAYMAPEVDQGKEYNFSADWWALGCVLYELCQGTPPFGEEIKDVHIKAASGLVSYPRFFPRDLVNIIANLLKVDPGKRLGNLENGAVDVKNHAFFTNISFQDIVNRKVKAPYVPQRNDRQHFNNSRVRIRAIAGPVVGKRMRFEEEFEEF